MDLTFILSLIAVWLQVRVLPLAGDRDFNQARLFLDHQRLRTA
jgi:hypothetical protein